MNESVKLASEVAHRILECHYGIDVRENSQLFTDLAEVVRASVDGEKLFGERERRNFSSRPNIHSGGLRGDALGCLEQVFQVD